MLPRTLLALSTRTEGDRIVPHYLTERDHTWLRALLDEYARFEGGKRTDLAARLCEPLPSPAPKAKLKVASRVLDALTRDRTESPVPPPEARWRVFRAACTEADGRDAVLLRVATEVGVAVAELEAALFADLRGERRVPALPRDLSPSSLASKSNVAIVASLLRRARTVRIVAHGNTRALVRHARLTGLICNVVRMNARPSDAREARLGMAPDDTDPVQGAVLDVSGPLALFHHTEVYGRALASLVPRAGSCERFELTATCVLGQGSHPSTFVLSSGDPIGVADERARYDSRLEERFANDFRRAGPDWDVIREPRPVEAAGALVFPDFELVHRRDARRRWLLEIVGFWTADYLEEKLRRLRAARIENLILCIDHRRRCQDRDVPAHARVIRYKTRIDARSVLAVVGP